MSAQTIVNGIFQKKHGVSLFQAPPQAGDERENVSRYLISGTLTFETVKEVWEQRTQLFSGHEPIVIDLSKVAHCDSAGVALLLALLRESKKKKQGVAFSGVPKQMADIIQLSGLQGIISV